jgi:hypothetical protein
MTLISIPFLEKKKKEISFLNAFDLLRYENSSMSEEQIAELVTETLAQVGLKVCWIQNFTCTASYGSFLAKQSSRDGLRCPQFNIFKLHIWIHFVTCVWLGGSTCFSSNFEIYFFFA